MENNTWNKICLCVSEFNYLFGVINYNYNPSNTIIFPNLFDKNSNEYNETQVKLRFNLIKEESFELIDSIEKKDVIEIIDALADILYVVSGAKVYFNLPNDIINSRLQNDNLDKIKIKISESDSPLNAEFVNLILQSIRENEYVFNEFKDKLGNLVLLLQNLTEFILNQYDTFDPQFIFDYSNILDDIVYLVFEISKFIKIDIMEIFMIVHKSNMTKVCLDETTAIETIQWYKQNELRYLNPTFRTIELNNNIFWIIYDQDTKKILKSIKYCPAKFI